MPGKLPRNRRPTARDLFDAYGDGLPGWQDDPRGLDEFWSEQPADFDDVCPHLAGTSKLIPRAMLWRSRELYDPGAFGQESQTTGDCVSHRLAPA